MIRRSIALFVGAFTVSGCSILDPEDPRIGEETLNRCEERVASILPTQVKFELGQLDGELVPTFTFDVTKLSLDDIKSLSVMTENETLGTRMDLTTNENATARDRFMQTEVTEAGAFFLTGNPALYRVRGEPVFHDKMIAAGCARQQANMRLIALSWDIPEADPSETDAEPENENNS